MIYIAGPWFTIEQATILENVTSIVAKNLLPYYAPRDKVPVDGYSPKEIYLSNIQAIEKSTLIVVVTDGKDVGTIFEAGYAASKSIPIMYVWADPIPGAKFNIMLSQSGAACYLGLDKLESAIEYYAMTGEILESEYEGEVE